MFISLPTLSQMSSGGIFFCCLLDWNFLSFLFQYAGAGKNTFLLHKKYQWNLNKWLQLARMVGAFDYQRKISSVHFNIMIYFNLLNKDFHWEYYKVPSNCMLYVVREHEWILFTLLIPLLSRLTEAKVDIFSIEQKCVP